VSDLRINTMIARDCVHLISELPHFATHMYSLYSNKIDGAGARVLAGLQHCTNLQKLK
jgi:hypothetical protein